MADDELAKLRTWIEHEGYPLEYETARVLRRAGFEVEQGLAYQDDEAQPAATREIDVAAGVPIATRPVVRVELIVECKHASAPWLVLTSTGTDESTPPDPSWTLAPKSSSAALTQLYRSRSPGVDALMVPRRRGFSLVQAHRKPGGRDPAFSALNSVVKAAAARFRASRPLHAAFVLPVIVVGGSLYQLGFDDGREVLEPVQWQRLVWHGSSVRHTPTLVDVVTIAHLPQHASWLLGGLQEVAVALQRGPENTAGRIIAC